MELSFNRRADELIVDGRYTDARALLEAAIREMPSGWTPRQEDDRFLTIAFWDQEEFLAHSHHETELKQLTKSIAWVDGSYSRAWYQLAVAASKEKRFEDALTCIDCGVELEPDHPELWNEKGYLLGRLKRNQEAFDCYVHAESVRAWAPPSQIARALRGQGVQLVDLDRLDEAEDALLRSLELESDSQTARNELGYIADLRRKRYAGEEDVDWRLQSIVSPPADPLTIEFLALAEGLPSIPGPKTVGPDNYNRIFHAYMGGGWPAFEEEFDAIVPREGPDYADVKRDLLREPVFSVDYHRVLAELNLGKKTVDEMVAKAARQREQKPQ